MKFKKLLSCFLSVAMCTSMCTVLPLSASAEEFSETVTQTVFELSADDIKSGNIPAYVNVDTTILDTENTSTSGVVSKTVTEETNFIQIDLEAAAKALPGIDLDQYTIALVANLNDSDSETKNGTLMYINGTADKFALRARESSDFCVMNANWEQPAWNATTEEEAHYTITDMKLSTGAAASHLAQRKSGATLSNQYSSTATGEALNAANAPIKGITFKVPANYRTNIKSLKITRKATFTSETYLKQAQTVFELDADALKAGTVPAGVTLNTSILDETATSASAGLISNVVSADTEFLKINLSETSADLDGEATGLYTIELVTNVNDSDTTTKNGTSMFLKGTSDHIVFRAREDSDICAMPNTWTDLYWQANTGATATYIMENLNVTDGSATAHYAKRDSSAQYSAYANGHTLTAGNANAENPINVLTLKAANGRRANIKSLKITRIAYLENINHTIGVTSEDENKGTAAITGLTDGQVLNGNSVTLTATAKDGYIFKGWYKSGEENATTVANPWTFSASESVDYIAKFAAAQEVTQTVYEMDIEALKTGTFPTGVTLNTSILDENATSASVGLVSDAMASQTAFLTIDLKELSKNLSGEGTGLYTIEVVANQNDSDDTTSNGMIMSMTGTAKKDVWRVRESADVAVLNSWTSADSMFSSGSKSAETASYVFTDLDVNTGAMASHTAKYGTSSVYNGYANGQAVTAGNASVDTPINIIEFRTALTSSSGAMRANIKSLKITRKAMIESVAYTINATTENAERGTVEITGVSTEEATKGQVASGTEVTLTATANDGYLFKGWYKEGEDIPASTEKVWTFAAAETANYTARFVESYVVNQTVYEMDIEALKTGTVPAGVTLNTSILDETATSASAGLISDVVSADTAFLTIDLSSVGVEAGEEGLDIYTIELVTNVNDSDTTTKNGTSMFLKGTSDHIVFRAREDSDICAMPNTWTDLYWQANTGATATYIMENLNVTDGSATAHYAKRDSSAQYSAYANGHTLTAGNASAENPISVLTLKAASGRRANIKSLKITRQVEIPLEHVNVEVATENDAYGMVTDIGDTAIKYSNITLSAESKDGYIFDGWYNGSTLVSEANPWNFEVTEGFSYTAKFRKVVDEWVEVYDMDIASILAGTITNGVDIKNLDRTNSSASKGLLSSASSTSSDFMTITFADLPAPTVDESAGDVLTDIYRVDMKVNLVDDDDTTKNGTLVYYNETGNSTMLLRARETRDGTVYKDGTNTIYGATVGSQQIPSLAYNFIMDTETGAFNQYVKHGVGDYYIFTDTASRGDDIALANQPEKIIIRNASYTNEEYRANIKSLSVKRLVKVVDTGNAVPVFSKERVTVVANSGEIWNGSGEFTTDVEKIVIDFGSEIDSTQITQDSVYITCDDVKVYSVPSTELKDGVTLVTLTGMTFEDGKTYKIVANDIVNVRGASLQKEDEYVTIKAKSSYEGITISGATIGGNTIAAASDITANAEVTVNVAHTNIATEKDVYVLYVAYKDGTKADVKLVKVENIIGSGNKTATFTTGNVSDVEEIDFIIWEGWNSMKLFDSFGF